MGNWPLRRSETKDYKDYEEGNGRVRMSTDRSAAAGSAGPPADGEAARRDPRAEAHPPDGAAIRHFTASVFVTHHRRVLLLLHRTKGVWLPPGGHVEPNEPPQRAAVREVWEETGLRVRITSRPVPGGLPQASPRPEALLEVEVEPGHVHLDIVYFARPAPGPPGPLRPNDEVMDLRWWGAADLAAARIGGGEPGVPPDVAALALRALRAGPPAARA